MTRDQADKIAVGFQWALASVKIRRVNDTDGWCVMVDVPDHGAYTCFTRDQAVTLWNDLFRWGKVVTQVNPPGPVDPA